jgi:hypothetical protein
VKGSKEDSMQKTRTHFEQVPLETIRKIIEQFHYETAADDLIEAEPLETEFARLEEPSMAELSDFLKR